MRLKTPVVSENPADPEEVLDEDSELVLTADGRRSTSRNATTVAVTGAERPDISVDC